MNYFFPRLPQTEINKLEKHGVPTIRHRVDNVIGTFINGNDFAKAVKILGIKGETEKINDDIFEVKLKSSPVEVANWNGSRKEKFVEIAEKFARETNLRIVIDVPHNKPQELKGQPGLLYIHIWSALSPHHEDDSVGRIFGIKVGCDDESIVPDRITGIPIMSDGATVGELVGMDLYIFHDICHYGNADELKMFARFLQEIKRYVSFNKKREREGFPFVCQRELAIEIERIKGLIGDIENRKKKIIERITGASTTLSLASSALEGADFTKKFSDEYDKLLSFDKVDKVRVIGKEITVTTKTLYCTDPRTKFVHRIGRFEITIDFAYYENNETDGDQDEGVVVFRNLDKDKYGSIGHNSGDMHAPHIFGEGHACWGNHLETMTDLITKCEIPAAILQAIRFVESVNVDDEAGSYICDWPYEKETITQHKRRMKNKCGNCKAKDKCDSYDREES